MSMQTAAPSREDRLAEVVIEIQELDGERSNLHIRVMREGRTRELSALLTDLQVRWDRILQEYASLKV
jgi:hypothetical protein